MQSVRATSVWGTRYLLKKPCVIKTHAAASESSVPPQSVRQNDARPMLQEHIAFFDSDNDGVIWPIDTFHGFQKLGFDKSVAMIQAVAIHVPNSKHTLPEGQLFDPRFPIYIKNIHNAKHGSDTGSFSTTGDFVQRKFEEIWERYDHGKRGYLTEKEVMAMLEDRKQKGDWFGSLAAKLEWNVTFQVAGKVVDGETVVTKEDALKVLDGSLFFEKAKGKN